jgi:lipoate-protein ligase A
LEKERKNGISLLVQDLAIIISVLQVTSNKLKEKGMKSKEEKVRRR